MNTTNEALEQKITELCIKASPYVNGDDSAEWIVNAIKEPLFKNQEQLEDFKNSGASLYIQCSNKSGSDWGCWKYVKSLKEGHLYTSGTHVALLMSLDLKTIMTTYLETPLDYTIISREEYLNSFLKKAESYLRNCHEISCQRKRKNAPQTPY